MRPAVRLPASALLAVSLLGLAACPAPEVPGPEVGAAYLGLEDGKVFTYQSGAATETLTVSADSSILTADQLVFDLTARTGGNFLVDDRTFTVAVGAKLVDLVRFFDCVTRCGQPARPIPFLEVPLEGGQQNEDEVAVTHTEGADEPVAVAERHVVVVSDAVDVTVPAGTFSAFTVSWTRTIDGESQTSLLKIAEGTGIVSWTGFDGALLELAD